MPLAENEIKCELSYAYLHAVASRVGCACQVSDRHSDGMGVDARLYVNGKLHASSLLSRLTVEVKLKATSAALTVTKAGLSFPLKLDHYDKLRVTDTESPLILVVLELPANPADWLKCSPRSLTLKRCAHWVSLFDAPPSDSTSNQTVYLPKKNLFTANSLRTVLTVFSRRERVPYVPG